jgi:hypothetical protein
MPPCAFVATTIMIAFLPLLNFIDISAELSELNGSPPVIDYVILMLILYYGILAALLHDAHRITLIKLNQLKIAADRMNKSPYGAETAT